MKKEMSGQQMTMYYKDNFGRRNRFKKGLLDFFLGLSSWPRMLLEVFIRTRMGERYFSFSGCLFLLFVLSLYPIAASYGMHAITRFGRGYGREFEMPGFIGHYFTWYAYLAGFLYMALQRREEVKRLPSVFDFARFSLSTGRIDPRFRNFEINGKKFNIRTIETLLEPAFFFAAGFLLWILGQSVGSLLMTCSVIYSLSYIAEYERGDHFVMDWIDNYLVQKSMHKSFVEDRDDEETFGIRFMGQRPNDPEDRRRLADLFMGHEEVSEVV